MLLHPPYGGYAMNTHTHKRAASNPNKKEMM
jgi:hypothetical protein